MKMSRKQGNPIIKMIEVDIKNMIKNHGINTNQIEEAIYLDEEVDINETDLDDDDDDYVSQSRTEDVSFIEYAIFNAYLHDCYRGKKDEIIVNAYGETDSVGKIKFGGTFDVTQPFWFSAKLSDDDNEFIFQNKMFLDNRNELINQFHISVKKGLLESKFDDLYKKIKSLAFNNSEYKGKFVKIKLDEGHFRGIEVIDVGVCANQLILTETQHKFIEHFITRVGRGGNARYLLNGEPGTGKTEAIREIARKLMPTVTFIVPEFTTTNDLTTIMEACEIFDNGVIVMDDIDLYLGSRDHGNYTRLLGQFLSFFDGVKKRKISLLASTNDKGLVDKAAERPGRFNFTLDFTYLDEVQIVKVCEIHLDEKWRIEEVYEALKGKINGKKVNITGAFIANLADNIREMSEDDADWSVGDTVSLITESYRGFYSSQVEKEKKTLGFNVK